MAYAIDCTFAGETSRRSIVFDDIVAAALDAQYYVDCGYDVVIIDTTDGRIIARQVGAA